MCRHGNNPKTVGSSYRHTPDVDGKEQEQPDHVDKVPVPGGGFKPNMLFRGEIPLDRTDQADRQKDGPDDHMRNRETRWP